MGFLTRYAIRDTNGPYDMANNSDILVTVVSH